MPSGGFARKGREAGLTRRAPTPPVTALRGRDRELARLASLLADDEVPIVTLWGPGGIGKTSLALTAIRSASADFDDVAFASLAEATTSLDVLRCAGAALGTPITRARTAADGARRLGDILASRGRVLLVLDNAETCIHAAAELVAKWRALAPRTKLLVTSREPLALMGEHVVAVPPLALPGAADDARCSDAGMLLLERARSVRADFDAPAALLAELVHRTEGIPLAIELCAARLDVLSAAELAERLAKSQSVLRTSRRDADARHRTLFASIALSHRLLDDVERRALSDFATLAGPFDLQAAEAIASAPSALDMVESLVRKSLLRRHERGDGTRISFYDAVRAFVREAAQDDVTAVSGAELRHAAHFAARALAVASRADSLEGAAAVSDLAAIEDELTTIVARYVASPRVDLAPHAATALLATHPLALVRGPISTFVDRARAFLAAEPDLLRPMDRGRIESAVGISLLFLSELEDARATLERAEARLQAEGAYLDRAIALHRLGEVLSEQGNYDASMTAQHAGIEIAGHDPGVAGLCLAGAGRVAHLRSDLTTAREHHTRSLELFRRAGDARGEARVVNRLGFLAYDEGRTDEARAAFAEGLRISTVLGDLRGAGYAVGYIGNTLRADGAIDEAIARYEEAVAAMRSAGDRLYEAVFRMDLGIACLLGDRVERARAEIELAARITHDTRANHLGALIAGYLVVALAMSGEHDAAAATARAARAEVVGADGLSLDAHEWTAKVLARRDEVTLIAARRWLEESGEALPKAEHVRLARRILRRALDELKPPCDALVFDQARIRPPGAEWIDLSPRPVLAALVAALAERRLSRPGATLSVEELLAAGWPGERVRSSAAAIRVRVAVTSLRKMGLAGVLGRSSGGYRLDPNVAVIDVRRRPAD